MEHYKVNIEISEANNMVVDAVVRNFEIIGEATKNLPDEIKDKIRKAVCSRHKLQLQIALLPS